MKPGLLVLAAVFLSIGFVATRSAIRALRADSDHTFSGGHYREIQIGTWFWGILGLTAGFGSLLAGFGIL